MRERAPAFDLSLTSAEYSTDDCSFTLAQKPFRGGSMNAGQTARAAVKSAIASSFRGQKLATDGTAGAGLERRKAKINYYTLHF